MGGDKMKLTVPEKSSDVIIFQPGSRHLYFGRATDPEPQCVLQIIARRRQQESLAYRDSFVPVSEEKLNEDIPPEVDSARLQLTLTLQSALKLKSEENVSLSHNGSVNHRHHSQNDFTSDREAIKLSNKISSKQFVMKSCMPDHEIAEEFKGMDFIVGEDVHKIKSAQPYNIHHPWRRGQLNLHKNIGGSLSSVMADLEDIWKWCVHKKLEISADDLKQYRAIVIIPTMFDKVHAREIMNMMINSMGFRCAYLLQDHVCASFGCGVSCATVVDIGHQKISISGVEDGISFPQSRLELKFGGADLTVALWNQLKLTSFPVPLDLHHEWDSEYLNNLKEKYCHLNLNNWSSKRVATLVWNKPGQTIREYKVHFGEELMTVPLGYFNPDMLRVSVGRKAVIFYKPQPSVSDDPFDRIYIKETARKSPGAKEAEGEEEGQERLHEDAKTAQKVHMETSAFVERPFGIEQAILHSIESCDTFDTKLRQRFLSRIVLVGGGSKIDGLSEWLSNRLKILASEKYKSSSTYCSPLIISGPKSGDYSPSIITWKGAALLSSLDSAKDLWISRKDWRKYGSKILREKSLFQF